MSTQRKIFAEQYELQMLDNGLDAKVRTSGAHSRYLSVTSVLMSRVTVHQALKDGELLNTFEDVGFKKVTFKNGYGFVQSFKLEPERENSIGQKALQGMGLGQPLKLEPTTSLTVGGEVKKAQTPGQKTTGVIWKDTRSGRTWQVSPTGKEMNWGKAKEHCKSLTLGGYHDWRLPTISELRSLIRGCRATQKHGSCKVTDSCLSYDRCLNDACSECLKKGGPSSGGMYWPSELSGDCCSYWSSSKVVADGKPSAWIIYFDDAGIYDGYHESDFFARCVR